MADSADILKEYLVSVGIEADFNSLTKFEGIIGNIGRVTKGLAGALATGIALLEGFVLVASNELEDLYWATKRIKSSGQDIQDFTLRLNKAGLSIDAAQGALEALAAFRRTNPAGDAFLGLIGVQTKGQGSVEVMNQLVDRFKELNQQGKYWLAVNFGQKLGLDERTVFSMVNTTAKLDNTYAKMYARFGMNADEAAQKAHEFENRMRDLKASFIVVSEALAVRLMPIAEKMANWLLDVIQNAGSADSKMGNLATIFERIGVALDNLSTGVGMLSGLGKATIELLALMPPEAYEFGIVGYFLFGKKGAAILGMLGTVKALVGKIAGDTNKADMSRVKEAGEGGGNKPYLEASQEDKFLRSSRWLYDHGLGFLNANEFNATYEEYKKQQSKKPPEGTFRTPDNSAEEPGPHVAEPPRGGRPPLGVRSNNPGNIQPGGKEAVYATPVEGLEKMAGLLRRYSSQGLMSIAQIINKYAPPSANDTASYVGTVSKAMGVGPNDKLDLNNAGVMQKLMSAMIKVEQGYSPYSSAMIGEAVQHVLGGVASAGANVPGGAQTAAQPRQEQAASQSTQSEHKMSVPPFVPPRQTAKLGDLDRSSKSLVVNGGDTTVTINGAKDPDATAKSIKRISDRSNGDLVRNFSPALG